MPKTIQALLPQYLAEIQNIYGSHLKSVILGFCYPRDILQHLRGLFFPPIAETVPDSLMLAPSSNFCRRFSSRFLSGTRLLR